jgi:steroid 5-alpha reductase family enzyme/lipocalin
MAELHAPLSALLVMLSLAVLGWATSLYRRDVSIVDVLWPLFFLAGALAYAAPLPLHGPRAPLVLLLLSLWSLRLSGHIAWRNRGQPEDRRYRAIRARNEPGFAYKSLYLVFALQAALAALVGLPLAAALQSSTPLNLLDGVGILLWLTGMGFEVIADAQLARFRSEPENESRVLAHGLWRFSRHPNYFGEAVLWWGFFAMALAAGAPWTVLSPLLMTYLLLRVSGVVLLEQDIRTRRPEYSAYVAATSAFVPWRPRTAKPRSVNLGARMLAASVAPLLAVAACRSHAAQPIRTVSHVELQRFMGDWYVIANIPTRLERGAHNAVESYRLRPDGAIATTFRFRSGSAHGIEKRYHPVGFVRDPRSNAIWGMRFVWPFKADYRIVYLSADYSQTVIGREARDYVWIMARSPAISSADYARLLAVVAGEGYDISRVRRVPQQWDSQRPSDGRATGAGVR